MSEESVAAASPRRSRRPVAIITAGVAALALAVAGGVVAVAAVQRTDTVAAAQAAVATLDDARRQERLAAIALTAAIDSALRLSRSVASLHGALPGLAQPATIDALQRTLEDLDAELAVSDLDAADDQARAEHIELVGDEVATAGVDDGADTADLEAVTAAATASTAPIIAHTDQLRAATAALDAARTAVLGAVVDVAATTAEFVDTTLAAHPLAAEAARDALDSAQVAFAAAAATGGIVALGDAYAHAAAVVAESHAAAAAAQAANSPEYVDPSTGRSVPNPQYNPALPENGGGSGSGGTGGGTPTEHPRAAYCASTGFANNQLCLDEVPATFSTNAAYVPWSSCNPGYYSTHSVGWGGNSNAGYSFPWSATVDGPTVTYYVCG